MPLASHAARLAAALALGCGLAAAAPAPAEAAGCPRAVVVPPGATLSKIALRCGTTVGALLRANPQITHPSLIFAGEVLRVPRPAYAPARRAIRREIRREVLRRRYGY